MEKLRLLLKKNFGYDDFRGQQLEIITAVMSGKDTLAIMPTGAGKSMCYQLPSLCLDKLTLVISPLIALMKDQVDALRVYGIHAEFLNSSLSRQQQDKILQDLKTDKIKLLYTSPERLFSADGFLIKYLKSVGISLIAIDEAHCISQWGHDFRPEYRKLSRLKNNFPNTPIIGLTATADQRTRKDILDSLALVNPAEFVSSFDRENIKYQILPKQKSRDKLISILKNYMSQSGIIYTLSRKSAEQVADHLKLNGYSAIAYHAGLDRDTRIQRQEDFIQDRIDIVVATIAFGMGIDKSNVRFVIHMDMPKNIESYYQQTGRAGRDGLASDAIMFFSSGDAFILKTFIEEGMELDNKENLLNKLNQMLQYGQTKKCRRQFLLKYFDEQHPGNCGNCDNCLSSYELFDGTEIAQKALSAVYRLNQRFGANYLIDFLRGSKSQKIREEHTWIKTFGIGKDISKKDWQNYITNLIDDGYLNSEGSKYPILKLTKKASLVLFGDHKVDLIKTKSIVEAIKAPQLPIEDKLYDVLKQLRREIATKEGLAPYQIFSDKTLIELAQFLPTDIEDLFYIHGFGEVKIKRYGEGFLKLVKDYCNKQNLDSRMNCKIKKKRKVSSNSPKPTSETQTTSLKLYKELKSIPGVAKERGLSPITIENHLIHFVSINELDLDAIVDKSKQNKINELYLQDENQNLSTLKSKLGNSFSYFEIKSVIAGK